MSDVVLTLIISLVPSVTSVFGCVAMAIKVFREIRKESDKKEDNEKLLKEQLITLNKNTYEIIEQNRVLMEENRMLRLDRQGLRREYEKTHNKQN